MAVYLNHAAGAHPKAPGVLEAVRSALLAPPYTPGRASGPGHDVVQDCRRLLSNLLGAQDESRIVMTPCGTHALNLALWGLLGRSPLRVVTSVMEHNSVLRPLEHLRRSNGGWVEYLPLQSDGALDSEAFDKLLARKPDLVILTHGSNVTGAINDVVPLFRAARAIGARTVLDACQSAGIIDFEVLGMEADVVTLTGHKGLLGPEGTGALYVAPGVQLGQVLVGGTGVRSESLQHPSEMPMRLEAGTPNVPALAGWGAALSWLADHGRAARESVQLARGKLRDGLQTLSGVRLFEGKRDAPHVGIVSFQLQGWSVQEAAWVLQESFAITCRAGLHCSPLAHEAIGAGREGTVRFSVSPFTTTNDIDLALDAVSRLRR